MLEVVRPPMALIGEVEFGSQPGQEALEAVPDMVLQLEDVRSKPTGDWRFVFWARGDDFERYEAALADDAAVESYRSLTTVGDRRLYRVVLEDDAQTASPHSVVVEHDVTIVDLKMTADGVTFLGRFPSREALSALSDFCTERDMGFRLNQLYEEEPVANDGGVGDRYGVTPAQRTALVAALESGYFDVPRGTKLEAIADDLDVSTSALSSRLRRGQRSLLRNTLARDGI